MAIVSQTPSISEVKLALAETSNSVGGLCTSPKINKWSKWKPVRHPSKGDLTGIQLGSTNYGFNIPESGGVLGTTEFENQWEYTKPAGDATSPYRLGDFRGYNHISDITFDMSIPDTLTEGATSINPKNWVTIGTNGNNIGVLINEMFPDYYFGICINNSVYKTADTVGIPNRVFVMDAPVTMVAGGSIKISCFMTETKISEWQNQPNDIICSLNAQNNMSVKDVDIVGLPLPNQYYLIVSGIRTNPRNMPLSGSYASGTITMQPTEIIVTATQVTVRVRKSTGGNDIFSQTYAVGQGDIDPSEIVKNDYATGSTIGFYIDTSKFPIDIELPELGWNEYYVITYGIDYI